MDKSRHGKRMLDRTDMAVPVSRATSRRTLRKRLRKMDEIVSHLPTRTANKSGSMMREVMRNQRAIMNFLLTHVTGEKQ